MKVKVIAKNEDFEREYKVRRMNYEEVVINYPTGTGLKNYNYEDVELVAEGEVDEFLLSNRGFLQIKLNRGISVFFYRALKDALEKEVGEELKDLNVLRDKYSVNKRSIWDKEIICVINNKYPLIIRASGRNFKREGYSILVDRIEKNSFLEASKKEINKILKEIKRNELMLSKYGKAIENLRKNEPSKRVMLN